MGQNRSSALKNPRFFAVLLVAGKLGAALRYSCKPFFSILSLVLIKKEGEGTEREEENNKKSAWKPQYFIQSSLLLLPACSV